MIDEKYKERMGSQEWKEKRDEVLLMCEFICQDCGEAQATQVHHKTYKNFGMESHDDLIGLCGMCHKSRHGLAPEEPWGILLHEF